MKSFNNNSIKSDINSQGTVIFLLHSRKEGEHKEQAKMYVGNSESLLTFLEYMKDCEVLSVTEARRQAINIL